MPADLPDVGREPTAGAPTPDRRPATRSATWVAAGLAGLLSLLATRDGPRITEDSTNYLAMTAGLLRDGTLTGVSGRGVTVFPPGLPYLLALADRLGLGVGRSGDLLSVRLLLAASAVITTWGAARIVARHVEDQRWAVVAAAATALSPALLLVWSSLWSDAPFVALLVVFLVAADRLWCAETDDDGIRSVSATRWLTVAVLASWGVVLLRYLGVVTVPVLGVVVAGRRSGCTRQVARGVGAVALAAVVPAVLLVRNLATDGTLLGARSGTGRPPAESLVAGAGTLSDWVVPHVAPLGLVVVVVMLCWLGVRGALRHVTGVIGELAPVTWTAVLLLGVVVLSDLSTSIDGLDDRILSGMVAPLVVLCAVTADRLCSRGDRATRRAVVLCCATWMSLAVPVAAITVASPRPSLLPAGATRSRLVVAVRRLPAGATVYSNGPEALWLRSGLDAVRSMPTTVARTWESADPDAERFREGLACAGGSAFVVWFGDATWSGWIPPGRLPGDVRVEVVHAVPEGTLFKVSLDHAARTGCGR